MESASKQRVECQHKFIDTISCIKFIPANYTNEELFFVASWDGTVINSALNYRFKFLRQIL